MKSMVAFYTETGYRTRIQIDYSSRCFEATAFFFCIRSASQFSRQKLQAIFDFHSQFRFFWQYPTIFSPLTMFFIRMCEYYRIFYTSEAKKCIIPKSEISKPKALAQIKCFQNKDHPSHTWHNIKQHNTFHSKIIKQYTTNQRRNKNSWTHIQPRAPKLHKKAYLTLKYSNHSLL